MTVYTVREQYPHREIACFKSLADARTFILLHLQLAYPIITSREVN